MAKSPYQNIVKEIFSKRINQIILFFFLAVLSFLLILIFRGPAKPQLTDTIRPDQIKIQKGEKTVIISEDGSVEYTTPDGVYYDKWDSDRVSSFFKEIRDLAKRNLGKTRPKEGVEGYWITLYLDGKLVKVFVEGTNELIDQVIQELDDLVEASQEDGPLTEIFTGASPTPSPAVTQGVVLFPSPTPYIGGFIGGKNVEEDCKLWLEQGLGGTVISNTVCIPNPSPTPNP